LELATLTNKCHRKYYNYYYYYYYKVHAEQQLIQQPFLFIRGLQYSILAENITFAIQRTSSSIAPGVIGCVSSIRCPADTAHVFDSLRPRNGQVGSDVEEIIASVLLAKSSSTKLRLPDVQQQKFFSQRWTVLYPHS
jgi:hypothetical protein